MKKLLLIGAGVVLSTTLVFAFGGGKQRNSDSYSSSSYSQKQQRVHPLFEGIELSDEQTTELQTLKTTMRESMEALEKTHPLKAAVAGGSFDKDLYSSTASANHEAALTLKADFQEAVFNVLTYDQQIVYIENINNLDESVKGGKHR